MEKQYYPQQIEKFMQSKWKEQKAAHVVEDRNKAKFYCLSMLPYPSGEMHMGHVRNYTIGDVITRYQKMLGKNVLQPMGWDAFGLPAENAALQNNIAPSTWTYKNIDTLKHQLNQLGFSIDWSREITTCKPEYYRWEQWLFIQLYKKGLVYRKNSKVNWDPVDQTVLANEQVINGRGWRSGAIVEQREIPQWFFKITAYADELLTELDQLQWPEQVKTMQRNWIGRSKGLEIDFKLIGHSESLKVFTTRPDTLMGVNFIAIAPEHPRALALAEEHPTIRAFLHDCHLGGISEASFATLEKKGISTPLIALHPITQEKIPVWIANYVLMEYGLGAVMSVAAHDERDFEFSKIFNIPFKPVISPCPEQEQSKPTISHPEAPIPETFQDLARRASAEQAENAWDYTSKPYLGSGFLINSHQFNGLSSESAVEQISHFLMKSQQGKEIIHYRLRDWGISRQRYWGAPIPMIHCSSCGEVPVPEEELPVVLPEHLIPQGTHSLLANMPTFYEVNCPICKQPARRETETFDTFLESSWYYARYTCSDQQNRMLDERANYWLPVDQYVGGIEHAVMHLLYARFIHKALRDIGLIHSNEPFTRLLTQGMVLKDGSKMSKSKGNTVSPQVLINQYGADTVRLFSIFAAPPEQSLEWSDSGVEGAYKFLKRLWTLAETYCCVLKEYHALKENHAHEAFQPLSRVEAIVEQGNHPSEHTTNIANHIQNISRSVEENEAQAAEFIEINEQRRCQNLKQPKLERQAVYISEQKNHHFPAYTLAYTPEEKNFRRHIYQIFQQADYDMHRQQFNTVVSASMKMLNLIQQYFIPENKSIAPSAEGSEAGDNTVNCHLLSESFSLLLRLLYPIIPHITEYLWETLGYEEDRSEDSRTESTNKFTSTAEVPKKSIIRPLSKFSVVSEFPSTVEFRKRSIEDAQWPTIDQHALKMEQFTLIIQVNGKRRGELLVPATASQLEIETLLLADPNLPAWVNQKPIKKIIIVPKKLISLVV